MRILMVASEALPFAKTGGLGDVVGALPRALSRLGHHVDVVIPRYRGVTAGEKIAEVRIALGGAIVNGGVFAAMVDDVRVVFVDHPAYYDRNAIYGEEGHDYADSPERFAFLAKAALSWAGSTGIAYDIVHAHDWQAGLVPALLRKANTALRNVPSVFTIHNLAYQGVFDASWLSRLGLDADWMRPDAMEYWGRISFLKAGLVFSRLMTTVSPRYAKEIQTPEGGCGFDGVLQQRSADLIGILNGIDYDQWDPSRDPHLPEPYSASRLEGKHAAKRRLLERYRLPVTDDTLRRPLVGMISRLVDQKGFDLLAEVADELPKLPATFVLLGTGERRYENLWRGLAARYPEQIGTRIGFDEGLVHAIEGGADLFLMPSQFEPCGLNQMYSLRYGTVPVVRATGGLVDTVRNVDPRTGEGTGFTFEEYSPPALLVTLCWALKVFERRDLWRRIQRAGMAQDFSWDASARKYVDVYERARA